MIFTAEDARRLEREDKDAKAELARALRVVEAAKAYVNNREGSSVWLWTAMVEAIEELEAGR